MSSITSHLTLCIAVCIAAAHAHLLQHPTFNDQQAALQALSRKSQSELQTRNSDHERLKKQLDELQASLVVFKKEKQELVGRRAKYVTLQKSASSVITNLCKELVNKRTDHQTELQKGWVSTSGIGAPELNAAYLDAAECKINLDRDLDLPFSLRKAQKKVSEAPSTDSTNDSEIGVYTSKITAFIKFRVEDRERREEIRYQIDQAEACKHEIWESHAQYMLRTCDEQMTRAKIKALGVKIKTVKNDAASLEAFLKKCQPLSRDIAKQLPSKDL